MELKKSTAEAPDMPGLPEPKPHKGGGRRAGVWALLAFLLVGGAAFWLTRAPETREDWRNQAADILDNATRDTPLAGMGGVLRAAPPLPPIAVTQPSTAPGTLAGQTVQAPITPPQQEREEVLPVPKVTEDSRIRPSLVDDLADYLVSRYKPGRQGGTLSVSVQGLNQRYGVKLDGQAEGGRAGLLRYAFHPTMLQGLYSLYVERFLEALGQAAARRSLTPVQTRQMKMALAGRCVTLAGALEGVAALPDMDKYLREMSDLAEKAVNLNMKMTEAVFELDNLRSGKADEAQLRTARLRVDGLSARYRRTLEERAAVQRALVAVIRKNGGQVLDEDSLLFVAEWVGRRARTGEQAQASAEAAAGVLRDLARRCAQSGAQKTPESRGQGL